MQVSDARPAAWSFTADVALDEGVHDELASWLGKQFRASDHVLVKDPRLSWFLPLWRRCAEGGRRLAAFRDGPAPPRGGDRLEAAFVRALAGRRQPDRRLAEPDPLHGARDAGGPASLRALRGPPGRLDRILGHVGETLDLSVVRDAPAASIVSIHEFVDKGLSRSKANWEDFAIPTALREQVDVVWDLISQLAEEDVDDMDTVVQELEAARAAYVSLYEDSEAIAQSSIVAGPRSAAKGKTGGTLLRLADKVPRGYREKLPLSWRKAAYRAKHGRRKR